MTEKQIEKYLWDRAKELGGIALKWISPGFTGVPDRIVILPHGRIAFAELKAPGKTPPKRQKSVIKLLIKLGCKVEVIDSKLKVDSFLAEMGELQNEF